MEAPELTSFFSDLWILISTNPVLSSVAAAAIVAVPSLLLRAFSLIGNIKYKFISGKYYGYHVLRDKRVVPWDVTIRIGKFRTPKIDIGESNAAGYKYAGNVSVSNGFLYARLKGVTHDTEAFLALKLPFNRGVQLPSASGVLAGVTQNREVAAVKFLMQRTPMSEQEVSAYFSAKSNALICREPPPSVDKTKAYPDMRSA